MIAAAAAAAYSANVGSSSKRERAVRKVGERERADAGLTLAALAG